MPAPCSRASRATVRRSLRGASLVAAVLVPLAAATDATADGTGPGSDGTGGTGGTGGMVFGSGGSGGTGGTGGIVFGPGGGGSGGTGGTGGTGGSWGTGGSGGTGGAPSGDGTGGSGGTGGTTEPGGTAPSGDAGGSGGGTVEPGPAPPGGEDGGRDETGELAAPGTSAEAAVAAAPEVRATPTRIRRRPGRSTHPLVVSLRLDAPGSVEVRVTRTRYGRRAGARCRTTNPPRGGARCTVVRTVVGRVVRLERGSARVRLDLGRRPALGRYVVRARAAGDRPGPERAVVVRVVR